MKQLLYSIFIVLSFLSLTSCNNWLDVLPNDKQVNENFWKTKEDVEGILASSYYNMRSNIKTWFLWSELRGGSIYSSSNTDYNKLQNFDLLSTQTICSYSSVYYVIGLANSVLKFAPEVQKLDATYYQSLVNSNLCEAYFIRAYCYMLLVRNYKEVPLVLEAYVDDRADFNYPKSEESAIIAQIKSDLLKALSLNPRSFYNSVSDWQTKGRVTKWAIYALLADVYLWNGDYDECINACNAILNSSESSHPTLLKNTSQWYELFYPGNSNESIFELNWDFGTDAQRNPLQTLTFSTLQPTTLTKEKMREETTALIAKGFSPGGRIGRMLHSTYYTTMDYLTADALPIYKYKGKTEVKELRQSTDAEEPNFIFYRVAELYLMKAEAYVMKGNAYWNDAVENINVIRFRAGLNSFDNSSESEWILINEILSQREMEFMAEGKRWYDLLRVSRRNPTFKNNVINMITQYNETTNDDWIKSVLSNDYAWYMPLPESDITTNSLLVQNPYYSSNN
jgi:starch-binding outer membrane protein, SusD/RagB family